MSLFMILTVKNIPLYQFFTKKSIFNDFLTFFFLPKIWEKKKKCNPGILDFQEKITLYISFSPKTRFPTIFRQFFFFLPKFWGKKKKCNLGFLDFFNFFFLWGAQGPNGPHRGPVGPIGAQWAPWGPNGPHGGPMGPMGAQWAP